MGGGGGIESEVLTIKVEIALSQTFFFSGKTNTANHVPHLHDVGSSTAT